MPSVFDVFVQGDVRCSGKNLANVTLETAYGVMYRLYRAMFCAGQNFG